MMSRVRRIARRLTYANVMATIAVFVSLGGVSYAVISIPPHSVGSEQLKKRAVGTAALEFPLAAWSVADRKGERLTKSACDAPLRPGEPAPPCAPSPELPTPGRELKVNLDAPAKLLVTVVASLSSGEAPSSTAHVSMTAVLDHKRTQTSETAMLGGQTLQAPLQLLVAVGAGKHTIGLDLAARYENREPGEVTVAPITLTAVALPRS